MSQISQLVSQLTLEEKVSMVSGQNVWESMPVDRLNIPSFKMTDGPNGARGDAVSGATAACFPVGSALAATWNVDLIEQVGGALGQEAKSKGAQVLLGPTVNIHRTPLGGRNFECYAEDPFLTGKIATAFIRGVQNEGVATCIKHFVCNDSEFERHTISSEVDARTLREIYLLPFEMAVKDVMPWSIMSAYNRVNGVYASSHDELINAVLRKEWGFDGVVISDWGAALETVDNMLGGLDLEMPGPARTMGAKLLEAIREGKVPEEVLDEKAENLLRLIDRTGGIASRAKQDERSEDRPEHRALARQAATEAMVLIKNDAVLPFDSRKIKKLAVIGPNAAQAQFQGGGSSGVKPHYVSHPLDALKRRIGNSIEVSFAPGCSTHKYIPAPDRGLISPSETDASGGLKLETFASKDLSGPTIESRTTSRNKITFFEFANNDVTARVGSAKLTGFFTPQKDGPHEFGLHSAGLARLLIDGEEVIDNWTSQTKGDSFFAHGSAEKRATRDLVAGKSYQVEYQFQKSKEVLVPGFQYGIMEAEPTDMLTDAVAAATEADGVVLVVGTNDDWETEGNDRTTLALPGEQDELVRAVVKANPNTVIALNTGAAVAMPWLDQVKCALQIWFPGQEGGDALCDVLFGDAEPSGRMPTTFPVRLEDMPAFTHYPGWQGKVQYAEGVFVGYRWYDKRKIAPLVPFGHGLGYSDFSYSNLTLKKDANTNKVQAAFTLKNIGTRRSSAVAQLYVGERDPQVMRPEKELRAFSKATLDPGEETTVTCPLDERAFAYWCENANDWRINPGTFQISVGASSADIRLHGDVTLD